jgi:hypothetical protein
MLPDVVMQVSTPSGEPQHLEPLPQSSSVMQASPESPLPMHAEPFVVSNPAECARHAFAYALPSQPQTGVVSHCSEPTVRQTPAASARVQSS